MVSKGGQGVFITFNMFQDIKKTNKITSFPSNSLQSIWKPPLRNGNPLHWGNVFSCVIVKLKSCNVPKSSEHWKVTSRTTSHLKDLRGGGGMK